MPPSPPAGAKIRANCGVEVRLSRPPRHPRVQPANEFTEACYHLLSLSLPFSFPTPRTFRSLLTFVTVKCVLTAPVFAISITYFCRDVQYRVLTLRCRQNLFFICISEYRSICFLPILFSYSICDNVFFFFKEPSGYNIKLRFLI